MLEFLFGGAAVAVAGVWFWAMLPQKGLPHRWMQVPYLQATIPIAIMCLAVFGFALAVSGMMGTVKPT